MGGYLGGKFAKVAPKRQKTPFGPSMESLGARGVGPRRPCLATLLRTYPRGSLSKIPAGPHRLAREWQFSGYLSSRGGI